ncbi:MAG TPA: hypothetical protein VFO55_10560, partial [Gemmatimonadaceae bacterium]|nr:hypothetical protein [Gemmatimonadaceae bacterium]
VWEGFGEPMMIRAYPIGQKPPSPPPRPRRRRFHEPRLRLPSRGYHVFTGPIDAATTSLSRSELGHQSANLWWPADHSWCVATEIDLDWTCVGGPASAIEAILHDGRFKASRMS